jgi:hypothetical protein
MFSHVVVGTNELERAKRFYDAVLGVLGHAEGQRRAKGNYIYRSDGGLFIVTQPIAARSVSLANRATRSICGMPPGSPTAASRSRTLPACATPRLAPCISPICAIRMATSSAPCIALRLDARDANEGDTTDRKD